MKVDIPQFCKDAAKVGLLKIYKIFGNVYYCPASDPNKWTMQKIKDVYSKDPNDSLNW